MPHNDYVMPSGKWATVVSPQMLARLDASAAESINGDEGGLWSPKTPIAIGGAGVALTSGGSKLSGGVRTSRGGRLVLPSSTYPSFAMPRSREVTLSLRSMRATDEPESDGKNDYAGKLGALVLKGTVAGLVIPSSVLHQGATLASIRLRFRVGLAPASVPPRMPSLRVVRCAADGAVNLGLGNSSELYFTPTWAPWWSYEVGAVVIPTTPNGHQYRCISAGSSDWTQPTWSTTDGATQNDGSVQWRVEPGPNNAFLHYVSLPAPATVTEYFAGGAVQELVLVPSANAIVSAGYSYIVEIVDESATQNVYHSLIVTQTNIATMRPT